MEADDRLEKEARENRFYRSALKQVVAYLNSLLVHQEEVPKERPAKEKQQERKITGIYKIKDTKKRTKALLEYEFGKIKDSKDLVPTRVMKEIKKEIEQPKKRRHNKFTEKIHEENVKRRKDKGTLKEGKKQG